MLGILITRLTVKIRITVITEIQNKPRITSNTSLPPADGLFSSRVIGSSAFFEVDVDLQVLAFFYKL